MVTFCALPSLFRVAGTGMWKEALAAPLLTSAVASRASASLRRRGRHGHLRRGPGDGSGLRHGRRNVLHGHLGTVVGVGRVDVDDPGIQPRYVAAQGRTGGGEGQVDVGPVFAAALPDQALVGQFDGLRAVAQACVVGRLPGGVAQV